MNHRGTRRRPSMLVVVCLAAVPLAPVGARAQMAPGGAAETPHAVFLRASNLVNEQRFAEAEPLFAVVLKAFPTWGKAHLDYAHVLVSLATGPSDPKLALAEKHLLLAEGSESHKALWPYIHARIYEMHGSRDEALKLYRKALAMRPDTLDAKARATALEAQIQAAAALAKPAAPPPVPAKAPLPQPAPQPVAAASPAAPLKAPIPSTPATLAEPGTTPEGQDTAATVETLMALVAPPGTALPGDDKPPVRSEDHLEEPGPGSSRVDQALYLLAQGKRLADAHDFGPAKALFAKAIALFPTWGLAHLELAIAHFQSDGDLDAIERALAHARETEGDNPRLLYWTGRWHEIRGAVEAAIDAYKASDKARPGILDARQRAADLALLAGKMGDGPPPFALPSEVDVAEPTPGAADLGMLAEAGTLARKAAEALGAARNAHEQGRIHEAMGLAANALRLAPDWAPAHLLIARMLIESGRLTKRTAKHLALALKGDPENPDAHYLAGLAWDMQGDSGAALAAMQRALQLRPGHAPARVQAARLFFAMGRLSEAAAHWRVLTAHSPENPRYRMALAETLERLGDHGPAEAEWRHLTARYPSNAAFWSGLADFYQRAGRQGDHFRAREQVLKLTASEPRRRAMRPLLTEEEIARLREERRRQREAAQSPK